MSNKRSFTTRFAGLCIRFTFTNVVAVSKEWELFCCDDIVKPDVEYEIRLLTQPLTIENNQEIGNYGGVHVYLHKNGILRVYSPLISKDGCQVACYTCKSGKNILYYPASRWDFYSQELHFLHLIGIEEVLLRYDAFLLHSSVVLLNGKMVLFSGPSEIGKSTQARLWQEYLGAKVVNGDRCIIRKIEDTFYGCGSPWAGTSGIYHQDMAPIKGIFLLKQSTTNTVRKVGAQAFVKIFQQTIVNAWDSTFVTKLTDLIVELLKKVPVYELSCCPDEEAVLLAHDTLWKGEY